MKILEVTSWEDICKILDRDPNLLPDTSAYDEDDKAAAIAEFKIWMISKSAWKSEGKVIDWNDWDQEKWQPWFDLSGSGFSFGDYYYGIDYSVVGSRRVFPSREISKYLCETVFIDLFKATFTIPTLTESK